MSCFSWTTRSHKRTSSNDSDISTAASTKVADEGWQTENELSVTSTAASSRNSILDEDLFALESEEDSEFDLLLEPARAEVQDEHLFFQGDGGSIDQVVRVEALEQSPTGRLRVRAHGQSLEAAVEDLLVDCRAAPQDDPKFTNLTGTRLCSGGRTSQVLIRRDATSTASAIFCEIITVSRGVEAVHTVPLAEAVAAVREARRSRDEAADLRRQRQLNDRLMGQKRRQALGFD